MWRSITHPASIFRVFLYLQFGGGDPMWFLPILFVSWNELYIIIVCLQQKEKRKIPFGWGAECFWHFRVWFSFFGFFDRWSSCGCRVGGRLRWGWWGCSPVGLSLATAAVWALLVLDSATTAGWTCPRCGHGAADDVVRSPDQSVEYKGETSANTHPLRNF